MTVCIAAICDKNTVIGASDRLITGGDIQFEPPSAKIRSLTNSIFAMTAGDANLLREILDLVSADVMASIDAAPQQWLNVGYVADLFCRHWVGVKAKRAEAAILRPLSLTMDNFLNRQATMNDKIVEQITNALLQYPMPNTACLFGGVDATGPHLYVAENGVAQCFDAVGFCSVGSGGRHSDSQLMLAQYAPSTSLPEALLLVHSAKKRAERAPGVGLATDMVMVGPNVGSLIEIHNDAKVVLDEQFRRMQADEALALENAKGGIANYLSALMSRPAAKQESEPAQAE